MRHRGPILFILTFLINGATRPGYDAMRNLVSQLATGVGGWVQIANVIACGGLLVANDEMNGSLDNNTESWLAEQARLLLLGDGS